MSRAVISALFTLLAAAMAQLPVEKDVTVLTDATMAAALLENESTFVMFYGTMASFSAARMALVHSIARLCVRMCCPRDSPMVPALSGDATQAGSRFACMQAP